MKRDPTNLIGEDDDHDGWPSVWMTKGPYPRQPDTPQETRPFPPRIDIPPDIFVHCEVKADA